MSVRPGPTLRVVEEALMKSLFPFRITISLLVICSCLSISIPATHGQDNQNDDVIRITSELVQTDVVVFDKKGHFVIGLRPEEFELSLDGKSQSISFFEQVASGSKAEAKQLAAARGQAPGTAIPSNRQEADTGRRGRMLFFFLDDVHLGNASLARAREALRRFVDQQMDFDDQVAIVSTSGQIGFLQQLTDNHAVLHAAIKRLSYKQNLEAYTGKTQISEYMASQILDSGNNKLFAYLMDSIKTEQQMGPGSRHGDHGLAAAYSAAPYLKNRLNQVSTQGRMTTEGTLETLRSLMLSSSALPGRKLVFFLSDGFIFDRSRSGARDMLKQITDSAGRAGAVVYTMDLRGTHFGLGSEVDASTNEYVDSSSRKAGLASGEISATRESLQIIADETGGRAIFNSNTIDDEFSQAINETSNYYLLAWRPEGDEQRKGRSRVKVSIKNRPELTVRLGSNFYDAQSESIAKADKTKTNESRKDAQKRSDPPRSNLEAELLAALGSLYSQKELPLVISAGFADTPASNVSLRVSMQIDRSAFNFEENDKSPAAEVDVIGAAVDDRGIISTFKQVLTVRPNAIEPGRRTPVVWNQELSVPPGLYQVRVAVRERGTGRTGSAMQWIEIPDMSKGRFDLSSLFLGERKYEQSEKQKSYTPQAVMIDVDHRFIRTSVLRFQTYVYNATVGANGPDVLIQANILRNKQQLLSTSPAIVPITNDVLRLPYWTEIPLSQLPSGRYVLQVLATDRVKNLTTSQQVSFSIE